MYEKLGLGLAAQISSYVTNDSIEENPPLISLSRKEDCGGVASSIVTSVESGLLLLRARESISSGVRGGGGEVEMGGIAEEDIVENQSLFWIMKLSVI